MKHIQVQVPWREAGRVADIGAAPSCARWAFPTGRRLSLDWFVREFTAVRPLQVTARFVRPDLGGSERAALLVRVDTPAAEVPEETTSAIRAAAARRLRAALPGEVPFVEIGVASTHVR